MSTPPGSLRSQPTASALAADPVRVVSYAHRGASGQAPENTLAAFAHAARLGAQAVELDVRRSLDGHLVVLHDRTLTRTTDVARVYPDRAGHPVELFTLAELRRLDAGSWFDHRFAGERIPTLTEAMDLLAAYDLGLLLEVKTPDAYPGMAGQLAHCLRAAFPRWLRPATAGRLTVESFQWGFVRQLRDMVPRVPVGLLGAPEVDRLPALAGFVDQINPAEPDTTEEYVARVHQFGMAVNVWTVDEPESLRRVLAVGVDGVISNHPDRLGAALAR